MAVLTIAKLGSPVLRQIAAPVDPKKISARAFQQFLDDMLETMMAADGIGLAAPQVSRSEQVVVMECKGKNGFPQTILINPVIVGRSPATADGWEGCLSVDNLRGKVTRPSGVRVRYLDREGTSVTLDTTGLYAVCIQHELDHLNGTLFLDRMTDFSTLTQLDEFDQYWRTEPATVI